MSLRLKALILHRRSKINPEDFSLQQQVWSDTKMRGSIAISFLIVLILSPQIGVAKPAFLSDRHANTTSTTDVKPSSDLVQDYAYTMSLSVSGKQGVVGLRVPKEVYLNARSADLNDLRLFDANGVKIGFSLLDAPTQAHVQKNFLPTKLFPIMSNQARSKLGDSLDLAITTSADGNVISVKTKSDKAINHDAQLVGLILDARQLDVAGKPIDGLAIEALHFTLPPNVSTYSAQIWLETSDDLIRWDTVAAGELSWLVNGDSQTLTNDRLEFEPRRFRYARLTWRNGDAIQFSAITAESVIHTEDAPVLEKIVLQAQPGKLAQDLVYKAAIAIPVEKISLQFTEPNVVLPVAFGSYRELPSVQIGQPTTWRFEPFMQTTFYQISQGGQTRRSGDISVPLSHLAEWAMRPMMNTASKPTLSLSWQAANLIFLASGKQPYTLAFGRDKVKAERLALEQVAPGFGSAELLKLEQAVTGTLQKQVVQTSAQGSDADAASGSAHGRVWILWGVLLAGVIVLGALVWSLLKQMKK